MQADSLPAEPQGKPYIQSTSCKMPGWMKHRLKPKLLGEMAITSYADDITLMAESEEELKSLLMKGKEKNKNTALKLSIQKMKIMASGPITLWQIDGESVKTVSNFIFLGSKITADSDCSNDIKRHLLPGRKAMTNLDGCIKKQTSLC